MLPLRRAGHPGRAGDPAVAGPDLRPPASVAGILTETGGATGHAAILARSLGIPAVSGLRGILREVHTGDLIALDGREGHVYLNPGPEVGGGLPQAAARVRRPARPA